MTFINRSVTHSVVKTNEERLQATLLNENIFFKALGGVALEWTVYLNIDFIKLPALKAT